MVKRKRQCFYAWSETFDCHDYLEPSERTYWYRELQGECPPNVIRMLMQWRQCIIQQQKLINEVAEMLCTWQAHWGTDPLTGSTAIARGLTRLSENRVLWWDPLRRDTSILSVPESVQYRFLLSQSTATPSGEPSPTWWTHNTTISHPQYRSDLCQPAPPDTKSLCWRNDLVPVLLLYFLSIQIPIKPFLSGTLISDCNKCLQLILSHT